MGEAPRRRSMVVAARWLVIALLHRARVVVTVNRGPPVVPGREARTGESAQGSADQGPVAPSELGTQVAAHRAADGAAYQGTFAEAIRHRGARGQENEGQQARQDPSHDCMPSVAKRWNHCGAVKLNRS